MPELFLALLALVLLILLLQKLEHAETRFLLQTVKWTVVGVLVLAAIYLTLVGRLLHVAAIVFLLVLLLRQDAHLWLKKKTTLPSLPKPLTKEEARALLKVKKNATVDEIEEAFHRIKAKDSTELDRLTQAREILLKKKRKQ